MSPTALLFQSSAVSPVTDFCICHSRKETLICLSLENSRCDVSNTMSSKMTYPFSGYLLTDLHMLGMEPTTPLLLMVKKKALVDPTVG